MKVSLDWLQEYIKLSPPHERIAERLTLAGLEVEKVTPVPHLRDTLFEVEVTTNRPDWLSHVGVAREIAAVENIAFKLPEIEDGTTNRGTAGSWKLDLKEIEGCPYYSGVLIEGITSRETPEFMKRRLEACGIRSIDLLVDITNYVLLETGQPLHVFDADLLKGQEIRIRRAKAGEKFVAIDGAELELSREDLVIADKEQAVALAGVMGGKHSEVSEKTRNVLLESAYFHPQWVRRTSRKFSLASESSYRFERRVDPEGVDFGRERALWLIRRYAKPRTISRVIKAGRKPTAQKSIIHLQADTIEKVLGMPLKRHEISSICTRLGMEITPSSAKNWKVKIPSFRPDLTRAVDLVEELARIYGYDRIPETLPERAPLYFEKNPMLQLEQKTREYLSGIGLYETVTFSLISERGLEVERDLGQAVSILNPQNKELRWMRPFLFPSLLETVRKNHHAGNRDVFLFEIANVYRVKEKSSKSEEERTLGMAFHGAWRSKSWMDESRDVAFYDLKGILRLWLERLGVENVNFTPVENRPWLESGSAVQITAGLDVLGYAGMADSAQRAAWDLELPVYLSEISLQKLLPHIRWTRPLEEMPRFPAVERDLSVVVSEEVKASQIVRLIEELGKGLAVRVDVFDLFRGGRIPAGYKNIGFRVTYQSPERTLISSEIQELHAAIGKAVADQFQASFQ